MARNPPNRHIPIDQTRNFIQNPYPQYVTNYQFNLLLAYLERCSTRFGSNSWPMVGSRWVKRGVAWVEIGPALCLERSTRPREGFGDRNCDEVGQVLLMLSSLKQDIIITTVAELLDMVDGRIWARMRQKHGGVTVMVRDWGRFIPRVWREFGRLLDKKGIT
jgi:hypothetical protein